MSNPPSKSARKREQQALQALGEKLIGLPADELRRMGLDERLIDAVTSAAHITARGARRRQRQLIGKLMRSADPEPVRRRLDELAATDRAVKAVFRRAEQWRDAIADEGAAALERYFDAVGRRDPELVELVDALGRARDRAQRRSLGRGIFRRIHEELSEDVQTGAG